MWGGCEMAGSKLLMRERGEYRLISCRLTQNRGEDDGDDKTSTGSLHPKAPL